MSKSYDSYMPKRKEKRLVQAQVDLELQERVRAILEKENWSWHEFVTGLLLKFLDEYKATKRAG